MNLAAVFHTGLTVSDLERSIAFYRDVLGLELVQPTRRLCHRLPRRPASGSGK